MVENNEVKRVTIQQAMPELLKIASELKLKVNNGKVLKEYFLRHSNK